MPSRRQFGRIRQLSSGRWQVRHRDAAGRDVPAPDTFPTKADAARYLARVQADMDRGLWLDPRTGRITFAEWGDQWLASNPSKRATTQARDLTVLRTHFLPTLGPIPLAAITPAHVKATVDAMAAKLAPATVRTNLGVLRAVLNAAVDADVIAKSPVRGVRAKEGDARERPTLTPEELQCLADAIGPRYRALVLVAGVIGLRWSEAIGLRVKDVDFLHRAIRIRQTISEVEGVLRVADTKSKSSRRTIAIPEFLLDELAAHLAREGRHEPDDLVFTGPKGAPLRRSFAARVFTPAVERAGLPKALTFHGLRHVATTFMIEAGEHPRVIQHRLGHATARLSMELYAHVPDRADREVATRLEARFSNLPRARRPAR